MFFVKKLFLGFALAFSMLTIIPFFKVHNFYKGINGYAVMFYPFIGLLLGIVLVTLFYTLDGLVNENYLYVLIFVLWVAMTGALHLDGVADSFDALFVPKMKREVVLKDPHIGAMGIIFTLLFILLKLAAFMQMQVLYLLPMILMLSRLNATIAIYCFDYIRKDGMGSLAKSELRLGQVSLAILGVVIIACLDNSVAFLWMLLLSMFSLLLSYFVAKRYFGGFSGDLYGFLIEVSELFMLHLFVFKVLI